MVNLYLLFLVLAFAVNVIYMHVHLNLNNYARTAGTCTYITLDVKCM